MKLIHQIFNDPVIWVSIGLLIILEIVRLIIRIKIIKRLRYLFEQKVLEMRQAQKDFFQATVKKQWTRRNELLQKCKELEAEVDERLNLAQKRCFPKYQPPEPPPVKKVKSKP
jgi:hypothetical protein